MPICKQIHIEVFNDIQAVSTRILDLTKNGQIQFSLFKNGEEWELSFPIRHEVTEIETDPKSAA